MKNKPTIFTRPATGFTLVELLVVIAITGLLASLLAPALVRAREQGRRAKCLSNMRQINIAMTIASDDNKGYLPAYLYEFDQLSAGGVPYYTIGIKSGWSLVDIGPNLNHDILVCPSDENPSLISTTDVNGNPITIRSSYGYNFEMIAHNRRIHDVKLSQTVLLFDGNPNQVGGIWAGFYTDSDSMADAGDMSSDQSMVVTSAAAPPNNSGGGNSGGGNSGGGNSGGGNSGGGNSGGGNSGGGNSGGGNSGGGNSGGGNSGGGNSGGGNSGGGNSGGGNSGGGGYDCSTIPPTEKVLVCHVPPGNPANAHTLLVSQNSCSAHTAHGPDLWNQACADHDLNKFNSQVVNRRHIGKANIIFMDGHAEWLPAIPSGSLLP